MDRNIEFYFAYPKKSLSKNHTIKNAEIFWKTFYCAEVDVLTTLPPQPFKTLP